MRSELQEPGESTNRDIGVQISPFSNPDKVLLEMQEIVGRKWHPILLYHLLVEGPLGFSELKERSDSISSKMLSESLTDLQDRGLISRRLLSDQPVRVEYTVTERGGSLEPLVREMVRWGLDHDVTEREDDTSPRGASRGGR